VRSSVKAANDNLNNELIGRTREVWQPRLGRDLSRDEAKQIAASVTGFFAILAEWSWANMPDPANDNGDAAASGDEGVRDDR
jgi:hypothetical protein